MAAIVSLKEYSAIRPPSNVLGLTLTTETARAIRDWYGIPILAVLDESQLANAEVPPGVNEIVIFADDKESCKAANAAADVYEKRGFTVDVRWPSPVKGTYHFENWAHCVKWLQEEQDDGWSLGE